MDTRADFLSRASDKLFYHLYTPALDGYLNSESTSRRPQGKVLVFRDLIGCSFCWTHAIVCKCLVAWFSLSPGDQQVA